MSGPSRELKLLPRAAEDIKDILKYTQNVWGEAQRRKYKQAIDNCLLQIKADPSPRSRTETAIPGYYRRHLGKGCKHYVFYKLTNTEILVVRLLYDRMDFGQHL